MKLTVHYDGQYWVGIVESVNGTRLRACKHIFGSEPLDGEVMEFIQFRMLPLLETVTREASVQPLAERKVNPKRLARQVAKELKASGVSTYAQEAMKLELDARKRERKQISREERLALQERKWLLRKQKAKEKHKGK
ncbi:YjdF family protein [Paenibacillus turpanensis]|uniref:YjdF family protein n=1 Tax=Paenibacillus turpanensis TaxID=2689078 RepID=UPI00140CCA90|nr:YjdF family protein [Paenibacillus turpanensis]